MNWVVTVALLDGTIVNLDAPQDPTALIADTIKGAEERDLSFVTIKGLDKSVILPIGQIQYIEIIQEGADYAEN